MIWQQSPGKTRGPGFFQIVSKAFEEIRAVPLITEDCSPFNPSGNNVMKRSWRIDA
jgi:hypothetical protein